MKLLNFLILIFIVLGCKNKNSNNIEKTVNNSTMSYPDQPFLRTNLPVGDNEIFSKKVNDNEYLKLSDVFKSYNNSFGKSTLDSEKIFSLTYKPTKSDTLDTEEIGVLKSKDGYEPFNLDQILPKKNNFEILIFNGQSVTYDYDGNEIITPRKDLVIYDSKQNKIIDEMNIYFDYTDGIVAQTKLYLIDKNHNIFIRYYQEMEEKKHNFSALKNFIISEDGKIQLDK